jgi:predicted negative regulator of RcsB-dependent stress response
MMLRIFTLLLACMLLPVHAAAAEADRLVDQGTQARQHRASVNLLIKAGALELAIQTIDRHQGDQLDEQWQSWERLRYRLYFKRRQYQALHQRYLSYPPDMPKDFRDWAAGRLASALLLQGENSEARNELRKLIWSTGADAGKVALWRRQVIESYLADSRVDDADVALIQYQRDYPGRSTSWQVFRGRVLIRRGEYRDAVDVLAGVQQLEARLYRLYAALAAKIYQPAIVVKSATRVANLRHADAITRKRAWTLVAKAESRANNSAGQIRALETALGIANEFEPWNAILSSSATDLWQAYLDFSEAFGNRKRLLVGDDSEWIRQAELLEKKHTEQARAIYAFLSLKAQAGIVRDIAHKRLTESLYNHQLGTVAVALYTDSKFVPEVEILPDAVRYRLAIEILRGGDIKRAAAIMKTLKQPPAEESVQDWRLRRARTMVYAGQFNEAHQLLQQILEGGGSLKPEFVRRYTQVVFDLQAVGEHEPALQIFKGLYDKTADREIQRELLYWMAESKLAQGKASEAAELYLQSAYHGQPRGGDMWGQSARYFAAEALAKSGNIDDARVVFENLLKHTPDAKRRAVIERNLQQLWLKQKAIQTQ